MSGISKRVCIVWTGVKLAPNRVGGEERLETVPPRRYRGQSLLAWEFGGETPRNWSINAVCVLVKAFS